MSSLYFFAVRSVRNNGRWECCSKAVFTISAMYPYRFQIYFSRRFDIVIESLTNMQNFFFWGSDLFDGIVKIVERRFIRALPCLP